jgi:hypothetical protein
MTTPRTACSCGGRLLFEQELGLLEGGGVRFPRARATQADLNAGIIGDERQLLVMLADIVRPGLPRMQRRQPLAHKGSHFGVARLKSRFELFRPEIHTLGLRLKGRHILARTRRFQPMLADCMLMRVLAPI